MNEPCRCCLQAEVDDLRAQLIAALAPAEPSYEELQAQHADTSPGMWHCPCCRIVLRALDGGAMPDHYRRASCGCVWAVGGVDLGCQDDGCRCDEHHDPAEVEQCPAVHWTGMCCLRDDGHTEAHMGLMSSSPPLYATWKPEENR